MGFRDVPKQELIERTAVALKQVEAISAPAWATFAKTGHFKDRPPTRTDWWQVRTASILTRLADRSPVGVQKLRVLYGGKKNRGVRPERFYRASGSILRKILQQLEKAGLAKKLEKGTRKGRMITPQGISFLDKVSVDLMKDLNIVIPKKPAGELDIPDEKKPKKKTVKKRAPRKKKAVKKAEETPTETPKAEEAPAKKTEEKPAEEPKKEEATPAPEQEETKKEEAPKAEEKTAEKPKTEEPTPAPEPKEEAPAEQPKTEEKTEAKE